MSDLGLIMMPLKNKFPGGLSGWQGLTQSYEGHLWGDATGFGIQTGKRSGVTVIDVASVGVTVIQASLGAARQ